MEAYCPERQAVLRIEIDGPLVSTLALRPFAGAAAELPWVAPAFWDVQTNGRWGISFSDENLSPDQAAEVIAAHRALGTARLCPTLISTTHAATIAALRSISTACQRWPEVERMVLGIHLEGPWLSEREGYRGAHPSSALRDPDLAEFEQWRHASGGRIRMVTLAPERPGALEAIRGLARLGVVVAIGHTAADSETIHQAALAGARLSTHLGNGIESHPPRHPNPIWDQASEPELMASLIADGHHVPPSLVRVLVAAKGLEQILLVSDFSPLAGLPVGTRGAWAVHPAGKIVVAGTPYLAGANAGLDRGLSNLMNWCGLTPETAWQTVTSNPARLLRMRSPEIAAGEPACLVLYRRTDTGIDVVRTCVDGVWAEPQHAASREAPDRQTAAP